MGDASERADRKEKKKAESQEQSVHSKSLFRNTLHGQSAWERHQAYVERYLFRYGGDAGKQARLNELRRRDRNDWDVLKDGHRFLRPADGDGAAETGTSSSSSSSYEDQVVKKYYDSLFKDLVLADLKHYKSGDVALRWRSEEDVIEGIGQFTCANVRCEYHKHVTSSSLELTAYEVNFSYVESADERAITKNALVKVNLCSRCGRKMHYRKEREREQGGADAETKRRRN